MDRDVIKDMKKLEVYLNMVYCDGRKWMEKIFWSRRSTKKLCFLKNKIAKKKIKENFSTKWITIFCRLYVFQRIRECLIKNNQKGCNSDFSCSTLSIYNKF